MKYLALTTGPLIKTLANTRKTRELWAASYLFSRLMREVICKLLQMKVIQEEDILLPSPELFNWKKCPPTIKKEFRETASLGAGLFPDQFIVEVQEEYSKAILVNVQEAVNHVLDNFAAIIKKTLESKTETIDKNELQEYLKKYFQFYFVLKDLEPGSNINLSLSTLLASLELQKNFPQQEPRKYLEEFFESISNCHKIIYEAFNGYYRKAHPALEIQKFGFDSLVEISLRELGDINNDDVQTIFSIYLEEFLRKNNVLKNGTSNVPTVDKNVKVLERDSEMENDKMFIKSLSIDTTKLSDVPGAKQFNDLFRTYHKYIAIVQADGDNIGKIIAQIGTDKQKVRTFSKTLGEFALEATQMVHQYGGSVVYAGGDDLLFFAPVSMMQSRSGNEGKANGVHILNLLAKLDKLFKEALSGYIVSPPPSLSFGVSISYYAFPMGEALEQALNNLFRKAKSVDDKNAIVLSIQKHSGNVFGGIYQLGGDILVQFNALQANGMDDGEKHEILKSLTYKLRANQELLSIIGAERERVQNFVTNSFDESVHLQNGSLKPYLNWIIDMIHAVYSQDNSLLKLLPGDTKSEKKANQLFGILRTTSFLHGEEL